MSLMKMMVVKCDENISTFKRIKSAIDRDDLSEVDRLNYVLEEQNKSILNELQHELCEGFNLVQNVNSLID
jgi:hypothetical protein